ncbi:serine hydrolase domain-containing protein [Piscinibacter sakaiensis]|uniref:Beta-lactamase class C n=1 Tax=Piscinibacter sakaiensis TaxID=1547922 RepID=A0A0K8NVT5_PISS1|nr:serine hydrolase domain-containing protein [Piscinibacter sakaiensis]GAP34507.1 beta-lactamase class C [Piscinibacter sakaiensis]
MALHRSALKRLDTAFHREVEAGRLPGAVLRVWHRGREAHRGLYGCQDPQAGTPMREDSVFRIYSMTKPMVSVALMMLVEEGRLRLRDPVAAHLPEFDAPSLGVLQRDARGRTRLRREPLPPTHPATPTVPLVHDLLRHTAGLTYGVFGHSPIKDAYLAAGVESGRLDNRAFSERLATLPLVAPPGTLWEYSRATDLVGALIERLSGQTLGAFLQERLFEPLGLRDTAFHLPPSAHGRLAQAFPTCPYTGAPVRLLDVSRPPVFESGGGGLVSTADDYVRFARMLRDGGRWKSRRLLGRKTLELMTRDHLGPALIAASRVPGASTGYLPGPGYGFGLGFAVRVAAGEASVPGSVGDYHWSGLAGSFFWIDPVEDLAVVWMMQAPERRELQWALLKSLVYAAL